MKFKVTQGRFFDSKSGNPVKMKEKNIFFVKFFMKK